ncbi:MAG: MBL fold metallo-hydrolase [Candidatus Helarchaeota archaeon]
MFGQLHILGSGSAHTTPCHGCSCETCKEAIKNPKYRRDCSTYLFKFENFNILIDYGSHLLNKFNLNLLKINYIFISHTHPDHIKGLYSLCWTKQAQIPVYYSNSEISNAFQFLLDKPKNLIFKEYKKFESIKLNDNLEIIPIPLNHNINTHGFLINYKNYLIAYLLDTKGLPKKTMDFLTELNDLDLVLVDANYGPDLMHKSHNNINEALDLINQLSPKKSIITHISHLNLPVKELIKYIQKNTPKPLNRQIFLAYDGLIINFQK